MASLWDSVADTFGMGPESQAQERADELQAQIENIRQSLKEQGDVSQWNDPRIAYRTGMATTANALVESFQELAELQEKFPELDISRTEIAEFDVKLMAETLTNGLQSGDMQWGERSGFNNNFKDEALSGAYNLIQSNDPELADRFREQVQGIQQERYNQETVELKAYIEEEAPQRIAGEQKEIDQAVQDIVNAANTTQIQYALTDISTAALVAEATVNGMGRDRGIEVDIKATLTTDQLALIEERLELVGMETSSESTHQQIAEKMAEIRERVNIVDPPEGEQLNIAAVDGAAVNAKLEYAIDRNSDINSLQYVDQIDRDLEEVIGILEHTAQDPDTRDHQMDISAEHLEKLELLVDAASNMPGLAQYEIRDLNTIGEQIETIRNHPNVNVVPSANDVRTEFAEQLIREGVEEAIESPTIADQRLEAVQGVVMASGIAISQQDMANVRAALDEKLQDPDARDYQIESVNEAIGILASIETDAGQGITVAGIRGNAPAIGDDMGVPAGQPGGPEDRAPDNWLASIPGISDELASIRATMEGAGVKTDGQNVGGDDVAIAQGGVAQREAAAGLGA